MAEPNITEEVHFEMLEKKADGTFKAKYPKVKSKSGVTFDEHLADYVYQKAGGTATAITLTINNLKDGYPITFIASANNNGAATTINGKPLYKPNTTTAPNLVTGKAYTVWYNSTNNYFFIKASAEGDASVSDVLAGKTFSNDNDTGLSGAMTNRGAINNTITTQGGQIIVPKGYHDGSGIVKAQFANLVAGNIKSGVNVGGVVGALEGFKISNVLGSKSDWRGVSGGNSYIFNETIPTGTKLIIFNLQSASDSASRASCYYMRDLINNTFALEKGGFITDAYVDGQNIKITLRNGGSSSTVITFSYYFLFLS